MKEFRLFDITDFVMDEDFIRWVNEKKKADNDFWDNWLNQHPDKHMVIAEARRIVESIGTEQKVISETEKQSEIERLMNTIRNQPLEAEEEIRSNVFTTSRKWWYAAAALVIMTTGILSYTLLKKDKSQQRFTYASIAPSKRLIENVNTSENTINIKLPDGSIVELAPDSRIGYSNNFDSTETRDIYLSGEAFFKVTKNPSRPFRVFANEIVTKVLGTSFSVRSFEADTVIQVKVRTGKVNVYSQETSHAKEAESLNQPGGIILTPNQELVYQKSKQKFQKMLMEKPVMILPEATDQDMLYEDASLEKVFAQLSRYYGVNIVYDNDELKKCTVTADLRNESFYDKLGLICKAIGARYELIDGQVVILTPGCE
jgi:ferric-dicitrate binding protein FerR (iron transport regulator)